MSRCPSCSAEVPQAGRFCSSCGAALDPSSMTPTRTVRKAELPPASPPGGGSAHAPASRVARFPSSDSISQGRFTPGEMFAGRYRIVGLLGRGGMGEVYRADDLSLGQPVALKFLPEALAADAARQARFLNEVRVARQVSHPNVCRVYDIGEANGHRFLTMEYVDGEDLASLLRRIGRLPKDKAVEIARQLCAGLASAHDRGVLHRDLKPANIMIDGRGRVRITDFGLAGLAEEVGADDLSAGTPAYMAPEQISGKEVSVKSDLYSLGIVLYEVLTGKRPFEAGSLGDLARMHQETAPATPSSLVEGIDPALERVILRCLAKDPRERPASALAVAAALPGGDPLAAALAAGETPSPEMVAAAGEAGGMSLAVAWACLASVVLGMGVMAFAAGRSYMVHRVPLQKPPEALEDDAREILGRLGYDEPPADSARGFDQDTDYIRWVERNDRSPGRWEGLGTGQPAAIYFWYRQSPRLLVPSRFTPWLRVQIADPPEDLSGMAHLVLDPRGRLIELVAVPPQVEDSSAASPDPDWPVLFSAAGLDAAAFQPAPPTWVPPVYCDRRAAWEGAFPGLSQIRIRVEAGAYRGRPAYFQIIGPWTRPGRMQPEARSVFEKVGAWLGVVVAVVVLAFGALLARRNLRLGRGDRKGALRLALYVFALAMIVSVLGAGHVPSGPEEFALFITSLAGSVLLAGSSWLVYLALEPHVRRRWPEMIISWSRLLAGRFRDPLVGRDVLLGALLGIGRALLDPLYHLLPEWVGAPPQAPHPVDLTSLLGARLVAAQILGLHMGSLFLGLLWCFVLLLLVIILRRRWLAAAGLFLIAAVSESTGAGNPYIQVSFAILLSGILTFILIRFGLLSTVSAFFFNELLLRFPLTLDFSVWYAGSSLSALLIAAAVAAYGFHTALAGRPLFGGKILED